MKNGLKSFLERQIQEQVRMIKITARILPICIAALVSVMSIVSLFSYGYHWIYIFGFAVFTYLTFIYFPKLRDMKISVKSRTFISRHKVISALLIFISFGIATTPGTREHSLAHNEAVYERDKKERLESQEEENSYSDKKLAGWSLFGEAQIDASCGINGFGAGNCTFTNTGDGSGSVCGVVVLTDHRGDTIESGTICSGKLEPSSSKSVNVHISGADDHCPRSYSCEYYWEER